MNKFWFVDLDNGWERVDDVQIVLFEELRETRFTTSIQVASGL